MVLLQWVGDEAKRVAEFGECRFVLKKQKRGFSLHGKGKLPPDGGFDVRAGGAEKAMIDHAENLASAYAKVTGFASK
jgi:hypothetical protein